MSLFIVKERLRMERRYCQKRTIVSACCCSMNKANSHDEKHCNGEKILHLDNFEKGRPAENQQTGNPNYYDENVVFRRLYTVYVETMTNAH